MRRVPLREYLGLCELETSVNAQSLLGKTALRAFPESCGTLVTDIPGDSPTLFLHKSASFFYIPSVLTTPSTSILYYLLLLWWLICLESVQRNSSWNCPLRTSHICTHFRCTPADEMNSFCIRPNLLILAETISPLVRDLWVTEDEYERFCGVGPKLASLVVRAPHVDIVSGSWLPVSIPLFFCLISSHADLNARWIPSSSWFWYASEKSTLLERLVALIDHDRFVFSEVSWQVWLEEKITPSWAEHFS